MPSLQGFWSSLWWKAAAACGDRLCSHVISHQQPSEQPLHCNHTGLSRLASLFLLSLLFITKELGCCSTKHLRPCFICSEVNSLLPCCSMSTLRVSVERAPDCCSITPPSLGVMPHLPKHCRVRHCLRKSVHIPHMFSKMHLFISICSYSELRWRFPYGFSCSIDWVRKSVVVSSQNCCLSFLGHSGCPQRTISKGTCIFKGCTVGWKGAGLLCLIRGKLFPRAQRLLLAWEGDMERNQCRDP